MPDLSKAADHPLKKPALAAGFNSALVIPLLGQDVIVGALVLQRRAAGDFPERTVGLMQTFAHQSVLAMNNAQHFLEVDQKGRGLAIASEHKSQFIANMNHELRTPLNAVLGYSELLADGLYGKLPDKALQVLARIQANGKHLLGLINDVLDISKMEAGQLSLALDDYSVETVVQSVVSATGSLAEAKGIEIKTSTSRRPSARTRRRAASNAGAAQPREQRHQVHGQRQRRDRSQNSERTSSRSWSAIPDRGSRPRIRPGFSRNSNRSTTAPRGKKAAPALACRSRAGWLRCMAADRPGIESRNGVHLQHHPSGAGERAEAARVGLIGYQRSPACERLPESSPLTTLRLIWKSSRSGSRRRAMR